MEQLPDNTLAESKHADDEDGALDDSDPGSKFREVILHRDDDERAHKRTEHGAKPADEGHQYDLSRHCPFDIA